MYIYVWLQMIWQKNAKIVTEWQDKMYDMTTDDMANPQQNRIKLEYMISPDWVTMKVIQSDNHMVQSVNISEKLARGRV